MKSARMLRLIGEVDEGFVDTVPIEDHLPKKRPIVWIRWASLAACLAVIVSGVGYVSYNKTASTPKVLYPSDNIPCEIDNSSESGLNFSMAGVEKPYTYSAMATEADIVVVADVTAVEAGNSIIYCRNFAYVVVREVLKGDVKVGDAVCVADPTSDIYSNGSNDIMMQKGNRVLLFLTESSQTRNSAQNIELVVYRFVREYPSIGKFFFDSDEKYHSVQSYSNYPAFFMEHFYADSTPKSLEEVKALIEKKN